MSKMLESRFGGSEEKGLAEKVEEGPMSPRSIRLRHGRHNSGNTYKAMARRQVKEFFNWDYTKYTIALFEGIEMDASDAEGLTGEGLVDYIIDHMDTAIQKVKHRVREGRTAATGGHMTIKLLEGVIANVVEMNDKRTPPEGTEVQGVPGRYDRGSSPGYGRG